MQQERYTYLLKGWLKQQLSPKEIDEFLQALQDNVFSEYVGEELQQSLINRQFESLETTKEKEDILAKLMSGISSSPVLPVETVRTGRLVWFKRMAAAAVFIGLCVISYFIFFRTQKDPIVTVQEKISYPVTNQATITLPDGTQLRVDTISRSLVLAQYGIRIERTATGELVYTSIHEDQAFTALPVKIENPRGSTPLHVQLTDGSHVWLNAQSAITYPVIFPTDKREVSISGEAYFEVAKDPVKKFIVKTSKLTTEVLGTHFNVKAYEEENAAKVTLLEGSVKVYAAHSDEGSKLVPRQQAIVVNRQVQVSDIDTVHAMAWKHELLSFNDAGIRTIMPEICRWYDVDVVYAPDIADKQFSGSISRQTPLDDLLEIIRQSGFNLKIEGRIIYVLP